MSRSQRSRPYEVLLVEDNPGDVRLAMEALRDGGVRKNIHVAHDGVEAMEFLESCCAPGGGPLPDLVLLDLNLPRKHGHEVLAEIREDACLCRVPVVIFTSSAADPDVLRAYECHVNCYVTKPSGFDELADSIKRIESFWLTVATLPTRIADDD